MDYLIPLAIARIRRPVSGELPTIVAGAPTWAYQLHDYEGRSTEFMVGNFVDGLHKKMKVKLNDRQMDHLGGLAQEWRSTHGGERLADASLYPELLDAVGRFISTEEAAV
jgi:hypothetical protein